MKGTQALGLAVLGYVVYKSGLLGRLNLGGGSSGNPPTGGGSGGSGGCAQSNYTFITGRRYVAAWQGQYVVVWGGSTIGTYATQSTAEAAYNAKVASSCGGGA